MQEQKDGNAIADEGEVFVCGACGKRSKDRYGFQKIDHGWDESCMMHAILVIESSIQLENGRVKKCDAVKPTVKVDL